MNKPILLFLCLLLCFVHLFAQNTCTNDRYKSDIFNVTTISNIEFGQAPELITPYLGENATYNRTLRMDIYLPEGDTFSNRPVIVFAFGGAFLIGFKTQPQIVEFCEQMAKKGYVMAAIDYRLGFNTLNSNTAIRAVYRAVQDMKAAIRFLKHNATTYGIDTSMVFASGASAVGIAAIHSAFLEESDVNTSPLLAPVFGGGTFNNWPDLGCSECSGNNLNEAPYNINGQPTGIIPLWGAIADLSWITTDDDVSILAIHGENDLIVNPNSGSPFNYPLFPSLHGSIAITDHMTNIGLANELYIIPGVGHEPWLDAAVGDIVEAQNHYFLIRAIKARNSYNHRQCYGVC